MPWSCDTDAESSTVTHFVRTTAWNDVPMGDLQGREGRHRHRDPIELPDGTVVWASSYRKEPVVEGYAPTFGIYLDNRWETPWPKVLVDWPDFGVPSATGLSAALREALDRARRG